MENNIISKNLELWTSIKDTPQYARKPIAGKRYQGTSVTPMYMVMRATEKFGAIGHGWGFEEIDNKFLENHCFAKVRVWYMLDGKKGYCEQWGGTRFVDDKGWVDEDVLKKSVTDALTKCLSYIGFSADIYLASVDDNKYLEFGNEKKPVSKPEPVKPKVDTKPTENKDREKWSGWVDAQITLLGFEDVDIAGWEAENAKYMANLAKTYSDLHLKLAEFVAKRKGK